MKKTARHILVFWLAATVLLSSTGLSVHHIYCYCKKESKTSLFALTPSCEQPREKADCCQGTKCGAIGEVSKPHKCADSTTEYVRLDADYLLFPTDLKLYHPDVLVQVHFFKALLPQVAVNPMPEEQTTAPPPPFGKALLPIIQSFLC